MALFKGRIGLLNGVPSDDLNFQYNPTEIRRHRRAQYADNKAALADFPNSARSAVPAFEWQRNDAEDFDFELVFHRPERNRSVDVELQKLDDLMAPDPNTSRPRDLILVLGKRTDRIRIIEKTVQERLFDEAGAVQSARVQLRVRALKSRSA